MRIQTFSIVAGTEACNARCPFCISKMTVEAGVKLQESRINIRNFKIACKLAEMAGVTTAMITGKGEPLLFPGHVSTYIGEMRQRFPFVELQTNGIPIAEEERIQKVMIDWWSAGLTTIAISIVHWDPLKNKEIYTPYKTDYIDLEKLIAFLHEKQFSVRLTVTLLRGYIDNASGVERMVKFAKEHKVEQLTIRPVNTPAASRNEAAAKWTDERCLAQEQIENINSWLKRNGTRLMSLPHGAIVYDALGQNVCYTNCLTIDPYSDDLRQIIFFPDGQIRYDWQYDGARLI
jgi:molybdenum cofactor biosynthesis enzyme MoaA